MTNEEAIKILDHYYNGYFGYRFDDVIVAHQKAIEALKDERPQGKWLITRERYIFQCSYCHGVSGKYNYCPNCGADMREATDNDKI